MKSLLTACLLFFLTFSLSAQTWSETYGEAQLLAKENGKNIVLVFSGSDWCAPCIKLERDVWEADGFAEMAAEDFVFYKADFPRRKANRLTEELSRQNEQLAEQYNQVGSFPLVVVLTPSGEVLGQTGYKSVTPTEYLDILKSLTK